jgi:hypothetical protein
MIEDQHREILETLNLKLSRKSMMVLGAILKSQIEPTSFVDFKTIRSQLDIDEGGRKGKDSLIYRNLSWLEKTGFIRVNRSEHEHGYNSDVGLMHEVIRKAINHETKNITKELKKIESDIEYLSNMDLEQLREEMISIALGKQKIEKPVFAEGWEDVLQLIEDKVYTNLENGDIVRFSLEWLSRADVLTPKRVNRLTELMESGINFRGLEHNKIDKEQRDIFTKFLLAYRKQGYHPEFRVFERQDSTYQFVGRNNEGIVLIVSENPMSATWIPRSSNSDLVENAIQTFDTDYEVAVDITEMRGD